jgi:hypothetical protein
VSGWREQLRRELLFQSVGRSASGTEDTPLPEKPAARFEVDDIAGCGHPGHGDLCGSCMVEDERYYNR